VGPLARERSVRLPAIFSRSRQLMTVSDEPLPRFVLPAAPQP
jgi:hypothetical protein